MKITPMKQKADLQLPGKRGGREGLRERKLMLPAEVDGCQLMVLWDQEVSNAVQSIGLWQCLPSLSPLSVRGSEHNLLTAGVRGPFPPASSPGKVIPAARPDNSG